MLELESDTLKFKFNGKDCSIKFPTAKEISEHARRCEEHKEDGEKVRQLTGEFWETLGLPIDVYDQLQHNHIMKITEEIYGTKKK